MRPMWGRCGADARPIRGGGGGGGGGGKKKINK